MPHTEDEQDSHASACAHPHRRITDTQEFSHLRTDDPVAVEALRMIRNLSQKIDSNHTAVLVKLDSTNQRLGVLEHKTESVVMAQSAQDKTLTDHAAREEKYLETLVASVVKAYPNDDPKGHRDYHEKLIADEAVRVKRKEEIKTDVLKKVVWAVVAVVAYAVWEYFKVEIKK